jgi:hypothetical protein
MDEKQNNNLNLKLIHKSESKKSILRLPEINIKK